MKYLEGNFPSHAGNGYVAPELEIIALKMSCRILDGSLMLTTETIDSNEDTFNWDNQE